MPKVNRERMMDDWDSIQEAQGFKVGDQVYRGADMGIIRNLLQTKVGIRARVHWPALPFVCEGHVCSPGSEQFVDLGALTLARGARQMGLFEALPDNSGESL